MLFFSFFVVWGGSEAGLGGRRGQRERAADVFSHLTKVEPTGGTHAPPYPTPPLSRAEGCQGSKYRMDLWFLECPAESVGLWVDLGHRGLLIPHRGLFTPSSLWMPVCYGESLPHAALYLGLMLWVLAEQQRSCLQNKASLGRLGHLLTLLQGSLACPCLSRKPVVPFDSLTLPPRVGKWVSKGSRNKRIQDPECRCHHSPVCLQDPAWPEAPGLQK